MDLSPLFITLRTAFLATAITFICGLYAARFVMRLRHGKGIIDGIFTLPLVLPPTVMGLLLLLFLGRNSLIGQLLLKADITIVFSWAATVIASSVVAFPLMYRATLGAFEQLDTNLIFAARTLGLSEGKIFWRVIVPNCRPGIAAGTILAFARALGEFGATIMIAGNIPGKTQTIAVAIYAAVQAGDRETAYKWMAVVFVISFAMIFLLNYWNNRQQRSHRQEVQE